MQINVIDTHCHLQDFNSFAAEVWRRAQHQGIQHCVIVGTNPNDAEKAAQLAGTLPGAYLAVGIHPVNAGKPGHTIGNLAKHLRNQKLVALGETGLDYFRPSNPPKNLQITGLREHLAAAKSNRLPVVIHTRPSSDRDTDVARIHDDLVAVLKEEPGVLCIIHCFSGGPREAKLLVEGGHYISFAGNLTHSSPTGMRLRAAARFLPLDHILVETDAPYVRPKGRFGRNEPAFILDTLAELARARSAPLREMAMVILENSKKAFNLKGLNQVQSKDCGTVTILS